MTKETNGKIKIALISLIVMIFVLIVGWAWTGGARNADIDDGVEALARVETVEKEFIGFSKDMEQLQEESTEQGEDIKLIIRKLDRM